MTWERDRGRSRPLALAAAALAVGIGVALVMGGDGFGDEDELLVDEADEAEQASEDPAEDEAPDADDPDADDPDADDPDADDPDADDPDADDPDAGEAEPVEPRRDGDDAGESASGAADPGEPSEVTPLPGEPDLRLFAADGDTLAAVDLGTGERWALDISEIATDLPGGPVRLVAADGGVVVGHVAGEASWISGDLREQRPLGHAGEPVASAGGRVWLHEPDVRAASVTGVDPAGEELTLELQLPSYAELVGVVGDRVVVAAGGGVHLVEPTTGAAELVSSGTVLGTAREHLLVLECDDGLACRLVRRSADGTITAELPAPDGLPSGIDAVVRGGGRMLGPTGRHAVLPIREQDTSALELVDLDTGEAHRLEPGTPVTAWSPDGAWVLVNGPEAAVAVATTTGKAIELDVGPFGPLGRTAIAEIER